MLSYTRARSAACLVFVASVCHAALIDAGALLYPGLPGRHVWPCGRRAGGVQGRECQVACDLQCGARFIGSFTAGLYAWSSPGLRALDFSRLLSSCKLATWEPLYKASSRLPLTSLTASPHNLPWPCFTGGAAAAGARAAPAERLRIHPPAGGPQAAQRPGALRCVCCASCSALLLLGTLARYSAHRQWWLGYEPDLPCIFFLMS